MLDPDLAAVIDRVAKTRPRGRSDSNSRRKAEVERYLIGYAGDDLSDREREGETVHWLSAAGVPIDLDSDPRPKPDLAVTMPRYYDWDLLRVRGMMHLAAADGDTVAMLRLHSILREEVYACRKPAE